MPAFCSRARTRPRQPSTPVKARTIAKALAAAPPATRAARARTVARARAAARPTAPSLPASSSLRLPQGGAAEMEILNVLPRHRSPSFDRLRFLLPFEQE